MPCTCKDVRGVVVSQADGVVVFQSFDYLNSGASLTIAWPRSQ